MINIELTDIFEIENAIKEMRNLMNSWDKSGSIDLMKRLSRAGNNHSKFLRMIAVTADITAPLYWWKEAGTVVSICSTVHKIHEKEFTLDDFSHEHLGDFDIGGGCRHRFTDIIEDIIRELNLSRKMYLETRDMSTLNEDDRRKLMKEYWRQMIQLLPLSYNQKRTVVLSYQVLRNIYKSRKNYKLDEWIDFCKWIEGLPYAKDLLIS